MNKFKLKLGSTNSKTKSPRSTTTSSRRSSQDSGPSTKDLLKASSEAMARTKKLVGSSLPDKEAGVDTGPFQPSAVELPRPSSTKPVNTKPWQGMTKAEIEASKKIPDDPFADLDEVVIDDDPFADLDAPAPSPANARGGNRRLNVTIEYDPLRISGYSELLMECIASRGGINDDYSIDTATSTVKSLGQIPAKTLAADEDRWQKFIFAVEFLRLHGSQEQRLEASRSPLSKVNPTWDEKEENVAQDGRTLGGVSNDDVDDIFAMMDQPIRTQIEGEQAQRIETNRPNAVAAGTMQHVKDEKGPNDQIWELALQWAHKPRAEWESKVDWMLEQKIKYCYSWLADIGEVPVPYPKDMLDIFWPVPSLDLGNKEKVARRHDITAKVITFWRRSVEKNGQGLELKSESYRTVLAAMALQKAIENHVNAGFKFDMQGQIQDTETELAVQKAAKEYFQAHVPVSMLGAQPGPLTTLDPNYIDYVRLCRQYSLPLGTILHEAKL